MPGADSPDAVTTPSAPPVAWSGAQLVEVRFATLLTIGGMGYLSGLIAASAFTRAAAVYLLGVLDRVIGPELRFLSKVGVFLVSRTGGDFAPLATVAQRYENVSGLTTLCFMIGLVVVSAAATAVWSRADRRRTAFTSLYRWMRVSARYSLATGMLTYATVKILPTQFGFLAPGELLQPLGNMTRFSVLWNFMAVSTIYTVFAGLVEFTGVALLFFPTTAVVGAALLAAALTNIIVMDVAYRVPSSAIEAAAVLLMLALILLAPYGRAMIDLLARKTRALPDEPPPPSPSWRHRPWAKVALLLLLTLLHVPIGLAERRTYGRAGHLVYGVYAVESFTRNGTLVTPLATDGTVWKQVASDARYGTYGGDALAIQFANGDFRRYRLTDDLTAHTWTIEKLSSSTELHYTVQPDGSVLLDGHIGPDTVIVRLRPVALTRFPVL